MRLVAIYFPPGVRAGAHRRFVELTRSFAARGHEVTLVCNERLPVDDRRCFGNASILPVSLPSARFIGRPLARAIAAGRWLRRHATAARDAEVALTFDDDDVLAGWWLRRRSRARLVLGVRSNSVSAHIQLRRAASDPLRRMRRWLSTVRLRARELLAALLADEFIFQTARDARDFRRRTRTPSRRTHVIPNSVQALWFDPALRGANRSARLRTLVFIGTLGDRKGAWPGLVTAFASLATDHPDLRLDLVGAGRQEADIRAFAAERGIHHRVILHGQVGNPLPLLAKADLLVVPSVWDSFPNVVLEAFWVGTPVIGTRNGGIPEMIGDARWTFDPLDPAALSSLLFRLVTDPSEYQALRNQCAGRSSVYDFDWAGEFEAVLRDGLA